MELLLKEKKERKLTETEIFEEKAKFISKNKDVLIDNIGVIGYDLFSILNTNKELSKIEEYKNLQKVINHKHGSINYEIKDEMSIIYILIGFIDRTCADLKTKEKYKNNLFRYKNYFSNNDFKVKIKHAIGA